MACANPSQPRGSSAWQQEAGILQPMETACLCRGSSCHFVFGAGNSKVPQAAAAEFFPPSPLTWVKTSCWLLFKAPSQATFSAVGSSVCMFAAGPSWTKPLSWGCGFSLWRRRKELLFQTDQRGKRPGFPPPSKTIVTSREAAQHEEIVPTSLERTCSIFIFLCGPAGFRESLGRAGCLLSSAWAPQCRHLRLPPLHSGRMSKVRCLTWAGAADPGSGEQS